MNDKRTTILGNEPPELAKSAAGMAGGRAGDEHYQQLRRLGGMAHQVRAATRAADHFVAQESAQDHETASWLVSICLTVAEEVAGELDVLAKGLKDRPPETGLMHPLQKLRTLAHQFHAAARAADHFLDQESGEDHGTGSWLIACAMGLADRLANALDDLASQLKRPGAAEAFGAENPARRTVPGLNIKGMVV